MSTAHMGSNGGCPRCGWLTGHFAGCRNGATADTNDTLAVTARERDLWAAVASSHPHRTVLLVAIADYVAAVTRALAGRPEPDPALRILGRRKASEAGECEVEHALWAVWMHQKGELAQAVEEDGVLDQYRAIARAHLACQAPAAAQPPADPEADTWTCLWCERVNTGGVECVACRRRYGTAPSEPAAVTEPDGGFWAEGREARAEVATWPAWKREAAARARVTEPGPSEGARWGERVRELEAEFTRTRDERDRAQAAGLAFMLERDAAITEREQWRILALALVAARTKR